MKTVTKRNLKVKTVEAWKKVIMRFAPAMMVELMPKIDEYFDKGVGDQECPDSIVRVLANIHILDGRM